jgi:hypothetical protein
MFAGAILNISALISELNGDVGTTATAYLMEGTTLLDEATGIQVGPRGSVTVVFSAVFPQPGTHNLRVVLGQMQPVEITEQTPVVSWSECSYSHWEYQYVRDQGYYMAWYYKNVNQYNYDQLYQEVSIPAGLTFPLENVSISVWADDIPVYSAEVPNLAADYSDDYSAQAWRDLGQGCSLYVQTDRQSWSYASIDKWGGEEVYYSASHSWYWGEWVVDSESTSAYTYGPLLDAKSSVASRLVLQSDGWRYGGTATFPVTSQPYESSWDYDYGDYFYRGYERGTGTSGYFSGEVLP